ncbi:double-strand break repair protein AddB [Pseudooctadecabacter jejudonensis]|uniref:PD-(D/E)XK nuclease superfamily protein n=1 Tax=Pseudooctadecabacter jejudonensis TaxID=1391910 RepID=A0A1Y5S9V3_9RHOB|nr:double-strand break repair protein AddB [Pseudooctadecabacter jejudonensis]SLN33315.1 PD-(D/E)XK nuclease superfamily protein [Pseudooctadecabacter jejudonensis]
MFDPTSTPRLYAVPLGHDFSLELYRGLRSRFAGMSPTDVARVEIYVNTRRMARRLTSLFHQGDASLLPRIRLVTDLAHDVISHSIPPATAPLKRKLEVAQLVKGLLEVDPTLASQDSAFDLADSLVALMAEMQGEGVAPGVLWSLNIADQSGHWDRALKFVNLVQKFFVDDQLDGEGRQRRVVETLIDRWTSNPPTHPIIVAGSTGSRGATSLFMQAVAGLPQGGIVLPGFDRDMPAEVWDMLDPDEGGEDHPQFRFKTLCASLGVSPQQVPTWGDEAVSNPARTALISLSLRPAPVTHQWIKDGPGLNDLQGATETMTLIEAPTPRAEADAIAARLRQAVEDGQTSALISPDRMLTRQVTAALDRWGITPDDSAGQPLHLSAPGRFLRHVVDIMAEGLDAERLLILLRHPLTNSSAAQTRHALHTNDLELRLRRYGPAFPDRDSLLEWANKTSDKHPDRVAWAAWVSECLTRPVAQSDAPLPDHIETHLSIAGTLAKGPDGDGTGGLWLKKAGSEAKRVMSDLSHHAEHGGTMSVREYRRLVGNILAAGEVRDRDEGHPNVLIWGTLEARVQSADLVILAGLNEGTWPEAAAPDPWLNRPLRKEAGLLLPERRIGLSAHDYQQAVCAKEVIISRAVRSDEAETVPSRWVNRLINLMGGLIDQGGPACLSAMRSRGDHWLALAATIAAPTTKTPSAPRPSPRPPTHARPDQLSVTQIKTLIRDPYAIYARKVLGLNALDPLAQSASAPLRGIIVHKILERFITQGIDPSDTDAETRLMEIADDVLQTECPWPATRALWRARIQGFAAHFLTEEIDRQANAKTIGTELWGEQRLSSVAFTLTGTADRIDLSDEGEALIYDYKTGTVPSEKQQLHFDKQLLLEAAMVEKGAFKKVGSVRTKAAVYVGLGSALKNQAAPLKKSPALETWDRFEGLIGKWMDPAKGYTSRSANETTRFEGAYDHLARYGEWDETDDPLVEDME